MTTLQTATRIDEMSRGRLLPVTTDGMEPTLKERGYAMAAPCERIQADGVYVLLFHGAPIIRRCQLLVDGTVRLLLDNPKYAAAQPDILSKAEVDAMALGRVVGACNPI